MAGRDDSVTMELRLRLDKAEKDLARFTKKAERSQINLKGIDHRKFTQPLGKITGSVSEFHKSLEASNARVIAFTASAGILMGVTRAFTEMAKATIDVEKQLKDINVILGASSQNLKKFGGELFNVAKETGQSFGEVATAATEFARQGLSMEKTLLRTRDALILTRLSGMDTTAAVNALTAAINSFSQTALTSTEIINKMANVDAAFAVSTGDLAEAIRRVGASAEDVKVDFNELIAVVTSVQQTTARGGNVIGNSLKTIFTRIQRTEVVSQLQQLGVAVRDAEGNMRPAMVVLGEFSKVYDTLNPRIKAQTAELVGGVYQMNILKSILKDLKNEHSAYAGALAISNNSTDEAIQRNRELNKTLSALINETVQNLTGIGAQVGEITFEPMFRKLLEGFNSLTKEVNIFGDIGAFLGFDEDDANKFGGDLAGNIMKSIGNFISGPGFVALGTIVAKLFIDFSRFLTKSVADFANLNKNASQQAALQQQIHAAMSANPDLIAQINRGELSRVDAERKVLDALKQEILLREQIASLATGSGARAQAAGFGVDIDKGAGTTRLTHKSSRKYAGFVPNFSDMQEFLGAYAAGYKPGDIQKTFLKGEGMVKYNDAEQVKQFAGMVNPAIMPPEIDERTGLPSDAGKTYKKKFYDKHGFDPYGTDVARLGGGGYTGKLGYEGFIPNLLGVLTSMRTSFERKGQGPTGRMQDMLTATREQLIKSQGVPAWLQGVLTSALRPGEKVAIKTMGQLAQPTQAEVGKAGKGHAAHQKGTRAERALAGRKGNYSWEQKFKSPRGKGQLGKMPVDFGTKSKTGRSYGVEAKPELKTKQIGQILLKTLYETNSQSLRQIKMRLQRKADAGDQIAGKHLDKLQHVVGREISNRGKELAKYTEGEVTSLDQFNREVGFDSNNAIAALREKQRGIAPFYQGFVPNFRPAARQRMGHKDVLATDKKGVAAIGTGGNIGNAVSLQTKSQAQMLVAQNISGMKERPETYVMRGDSIAKRIQAGSRGNTQALSKIMQGTGMKVSPKDLTSLTQRLSKSNVAVSFGVSGVKDIEKQSGIREQVKSQLADAYTNIILNTSKMLTKGTKIKPVNKAGVKTRAQKYVGDTISSSLQGEIFEDSITTAIGQSSSWLNKDTNDYRRWDFQPSDAGNLQKIFDESFGSYSDAKRSYNPHSIESMATKILFGTPEGQATIKSLMQANFRGTSQGMATLARQEQKAGIKSNIKLMAQGFIPDREALKTAMDTERAMGGDPVVDFDKKIGYFVRDKKTQASLADVKRDHPEGWEKAFNNSEKMQARLGGGGGYTSKFGHDGVIPNFATGMDMAMITGSLGFLAMGINDNVKSFKEVSKAAGTLQEELGATEKAERDANEARKQSLEDRKKLGKESRDAEKKATKSESKADRTQNKEARKLVGKDSTTGVDKYASRRTATGLVNTKGMTKDERKEYREELAKVNKRLISEKKKVTKTLTLEEKAARDAIAKAKTKAQKDRALAQAKQAEHKASVENTNATRQSARDSRRNSAAKQAEATAHNKNAAMTGGQVVKGKGVQGGTAGGRAMNAGQGMGMGAMMALPMVGGMARTVAGDSEKAQGVIGGVETAGSFAMMGAMTGNPYIAGAALAGGALIGIMQAMGPYKDPLAQLKKTAEEAKEKLTQFQNSSQQYLGAFEKLEEGMKSSTIKPEELAKRKDALEDALMDMPAHVRQQFSHVKKDAESIKKFFDETAKTLSDESRIATGAAHYQEKIYGGERSWWQDMGRGAMRGMGWDQEGLKGTFLEDFGVQKGDDIFKGAAGKKNLVDYTQMISREVDKDMLKGDEGGKNIAGLQALVSSIGTDMDANELEKFVKELRAFGVPEEYIEQFRKTAENTKSGAKAAESLGKSLTDLRQNMLDVEEAARIIKLNKAIDDRYDAEMKRIKDATNLTMTKMNMEIKLEKQRIDFINKMKTRRDDMGLNWSEMYAGEGINQMKPFMGKVETGRMDTELKVMKMNAGLVKNQRKAITEAMNKTFNVTQKQLLDSVKKLQGHMAKAPTAEQTRSIEKDTNRQMALTEALMPIMVDHLGEIKKKPTEFKDMSGVLGEIEEALRTGGANNPELMAEVIGLEMKDISEVFAQKMSLLIDENEMQKTILLDQHRLQEQALIVQEKIASYGGPMGGQSIGRFGAPTNQEALTNKTMNFLIRSMLPKGPKVNVERGGIPAEGLTPDGRSKIDAGRAATALLDHLVNNMNIRDTHGERLQPEAFGALAGIGMAGRMETIKQELAEAKKQLKFQGVGEGDKAYQALEKASDPEAIAQTAAAQMAKQMKFDLMPDQMMEMNQGLQILQDIIVAQGNELFENNKQAFISAIKATELDKITDHFNSDIIAFNNNLVKADSENTGEIVAGQKTIAKDVTGGANAIIMAQGNLDQAVVNAGANAATATERGTAAINEQAKADAIAADNHMMNLRKENIDGVNQTNKYSQAVGNSMSANMHAVGKQGAKNQNTNFSNLDRNLEIISDAEAEHVSKQHFEDRRFTGEQLDNVAVNGTSDANEIVKAINILNELMNQGQAAKREQEWLKENGDVLIDALKMRDKEKWLVEEKALRSRGNVMPANKVAPGPAGEKALLDKYPGPKRTDDEYYEEAAALIKQGGSKVFDMIKDADIARVLREGSISRKAYAENFRSPKDNAVTQKMGMEGRFQHWAASMAGGASGKVAGVDSKAMYSWFKTQGIDLLKIKSMEELEGIVQGPGRKGFLRKGTTEFGLQKPGGHMTSRALAQRGKTSYNQNEWTVDGTYGEVSLSRIDVQKALARIFGYEAKQSHSVSGPNLGPTNSGLTGTDREGGIFTQFRNRGGRGGILSKAQLPGSWEREKATMSMHPLNQLTADQERILRTELIPRIVDAANAKAKEGKGAKGSAKMTGPEVKAAAMQGTWTTRVSRSDQDGKRKTPGVDLYQSLTDKDWEQLAAQLNAYEGDIDTRSDELEKLLEARNKWFKDNNGDIRKANEKMQAQTGFGQLFDFNIGTLNMKNNYGKNFAKETSKVSKYNKTLKPGQVKLLTPTDIMYGNFDFGEDENRSDSRTYRPWESQMAVGGTRNNLRNQLNTRRRDKQTGAHYTELDQMRRIRLRSQRNLINYSQRAHTGLDFDDQTYLGKQQKRWGVSDKTRGFQAKGGMALEKDIFKDFEGVKYADVDALKRNKDKVDAELKILGQLKKETKDMEGPAGADAGVWAFSDEIQKQVIARFGESAMDWDADKLNSQLNIAEKDLGVFKHSLTRMTDFSEQRANMAKRVEELRNLAMLEQKGQDVDARRTAILEDWANNKRADLATKINDLNREIDLQKLDPTMYEDERVAKMRTRTKALQRKKDGSYSMKNTFADIAQSWKYSADMMERDAEDALFNVSQQFRSEVSTAFGALIDGTKDAREAFGDLFEGIGKMVQKQLIEMAVNRFIFNPLSNMFGGAKGGIVGNDGIQRFGFGGSVGAFGGMAAIASQTGIFGAMGQKAAAQKGKKRALMGGMVVGGSGVKDDVPALLQKGEYVIRKSSVRKYGLGFLNSVNAEGKDPSTLADGGFPTGDPSRDPQSQMDSLTEYQAGNTGQMARFNLRNAFIYDSDKPTLGGSHYAIDPRLTRQALMDEDNPRNQIRADKVAGLLDYQIERARELQAWKDEVDEFNRMKKKKMRNTLLMALGMTALGTMFPGNQPAPFGTSGNRFGRGMSNFFSGRGGAGVGRPIGGIPGGGGNQGGMPGLDAQGGYKSRDNVPSLLMGGEYVVRPDAVRNYGVDFFHALNTGRLKKYADGGYVDAKGTPAPGASPLDRASEGSTNNVSITVNIDQKGGITTSSNGMDREDGRNLAAIIKNEVVNTLVNQKRQGGILYDGNISGT